MTKTIAYVLYPGLTALDLVGPLTVTAALGPEFATVVVADDLAPIDSDTTLRLGASATFDEVTDPYCVVVPGGTAGTLAACADERLLDWLRSVSATTEVTASVCTGSLILGAAGLLTGKRAATHWAWRDLLLPFGAEVSEARVERDGNLFTGGGVTAGIDLALTVAAEIAGEPYAQAVQLGIEYAPAPPFDSGRPELASPEVLATVTRRMAPIANARYAAAEQAAGRLETA